MVCSFHVGTIAQHARFDKLQCLCYSVYMTVKFVYINPEDLLDALTASRVSLDYAIKEAVCIDNKLLARKAEKVFNDYLRGRCTRQEASAALCKMSVKCRSCTDIMDDLYGHYKEIWCLPDEDRPWRVTWVGAGDLLEAEDTSESCP